MFFFEILNCFMPLVRFTIRRNPLLCLSLNLIVMPFDYRVIKRRLRGHTFVGTNFRDSQKEPLEISTIDRRSKSGVVI